MLNKPLCLLRGLRMYIHYWIYEDLKVYIIRKNPHRIKILVFPWLYYFPNVNYTSKKCSLTRKYQEDLHDQEIEEKRWGGNKWFRSRKWWETLNSKSAMHMGIRHQWQALLPNHVKAAMRSQTIRSSITLTWPSTMLLATVVWQSPLAMMRNNEMVIYIFMRY